MGAFHASGGSERLASGKAGGHGKGGNSRTPEYRKGKERKRGPGPEEIYLIIKEDSHQARRRRRKTTTTTKVEHSPPSQ